MPILLIFLFVVLKSHVIVYKKPQTGSEKSDGTGFLETGGDINDFAFFLKEESEWKQELSAAQTGSHWSGQKR